jgi:leucyl/phenylalanyl-tRNA--protein transferase
VTRRSATEWAFPELDELPDDDLVAFGADLEPLTLIEAYRHGFFPMPLSVIDQIGHRDGRSMRDRIPRRRLGWFSPIERGVLFPGDIHVSRSLRSSMRRFTVSVDTAFADVIHACADPGRPHGWIDRSIIVAYTRLHHLGIAHSVEVWDGDSLAGGLYGVALGGFFAGESMFHRRTDASKVAMVALADLVGAEPHRLIDVQWVTPHLERMGCVAIGRREYADRLGAALLLDTPEAFRPTP